MSGPMRRSSLLLAFFLAGSLPGCLSVFNPLPPTPVEFRDTCSALPMSSRQNVYVVLVNGVDPFCCGNLAGIRESLGELGFTKSYYAQLYHEECLTKELRAVHAEHPDAHFAIVGFEHGATAARKLAERAGAEGLPVDLLVFLQPKGLHHDFGIAPSAVRRFITIRAGNDELAHANLEAGEIIDVPCFTRYGIPTHPDTLKLLATELIHLASGIPVIAPLVEPFPSMLEDPAPPPRPVTVRQEERVDDWDFLKPVSRRRVAAYDGTKVDELPMPREVGLIKDEVVPPLD